MPGEEIRGKSDHAFIGQVSRLDWSYPGRRVFRGLAVNHFDRVVDQWDTAMYIHLSVDGGGN